MYSFYPVDYSQYSQVLLKKNVPESGWSQKTYNAPQPEPEEEEEDPPEPTPPPTPPPEPVQITKHANNDILVSGVRTLFPTLTENVAEITDYMVIDEFLYNTDFGRWLRHGLDLSKVVDYTVIINGRNVLYNVAPAEPIPVFQAKYTVPFYSFDNLSEYRGNLYINPLDIPSYNEANCYVFKSVVNYFGLNDTPYYREEVRTHLTSGNGDPVTYIGQSTTSKTSAIYKVITEDDLPLENLITGNFTHQRLAFCTLWSQFDYATNVEANSVVNVDFQVVYTD